MTNHFCYKWINKIFTFSTKLIFKPLPKLMIFYFLFFGCSKGQTEVQKKEIEVEIEIPQAVKELINDFKVNQPNCSCNPYIVQYIWRNENIYVLAYNGSSNTGYICDWIPTFYHSDGQKFTLESGYTYEKFFNDSRLIKTVWSCK
jgi:hypothetical protein